MEERIDWTAVARYLLGDMTEEEKSMFGQQLEEDEAFRVVFQEVSLLWNQSAELGKKIHGPLSSDEMEAQIEKLKSLIGQEENEWTKMARFLQSDDQLDEAPVSAELHTGQQLWEASRALGQKYHAAQPVDLNSHIAKMQQRMKAAEAGIADENLQVETSVKPSPLRIEKEENTEQVQLGRRNFFLRIAAAVALIVSATAVGYYFSTGYDEAVSYATLQTKTGEVRNLVLSDGSVVWVNQNSTLKYPEKFQADARQVLLEGEAFFDVAKDANRPFTILTESTKTTVLGTSFNIQGYQGQAVTLAVNTGKVEFGSRENAALKELVTPNQIAVLSATNELSVTEGDATAYSKWKQATLEFHDKNLSEVILVLEKTFDVTIQLEAKELATRKFSGKFEKQTIIEILNILSEIIGFTYENDETNFVIKQK